MESPRPFRKSFALVIGVNAYSSGIPALRTARNDARRVAEILGRDHGYEVIELLDDAATGERIAAVLQHELSAQVTEDDRVFFYFAGHGVAHDGDDGPNGYLLPFDAKRGDESTYLQMPLVHDALLALTCRHMLVVLDSCFSGAFRWSGTRDVVRAAEVIHQEKFDRFVRDAAWQVITSASQDQKALDQLSSGALGARDGEDVHSPFALALFDALGGAGDVVPRDVGDGLVTATELYLYVDETLQNAVGEVGRTQTPGLWSLRKHDKGQFVFFVPGRDLNLPPAPPLTFDNKPWLGLASYDAKHAPLFFGRETETAALRQLVEARPLTVVAGASGAGKSSLVKAGVLPQLVDSGWQVLPVVRLGSKPLEAIAQAVAADGARPPAATTEAITKAVQQLIASKPGARVVLVIDQFEELITQVRTPRDREQTLSMLATLATAHPDSLRLIVTIRSDFEPNFDRSAFGDAWRNGRFVLPVMTRENLRAVIEKPAAARVLYFDPYSLVETLLDEIMATPGALPLLSFALSEMYIRYVKRQSNDRAISRADYDAVGGVVGALRTHADAEYERLDASSQETLRRVMLRLVTSGEGGVARRRATNAELDFPEEAEQQRAKAVVHQFTESRLLVEGKEPDGEPFVEPAHDALVRTWGRLLQWLREENEKPFPLAQQQRLGRSAAEWDSAAPAAKSGLLWSDASRSAQLSPLVRSKAPWLNRRERAFARRSIRGRRIQMAIAAGVTALIAVSAIVSAVQWRRAEAASIIAQQEAERAEAEKVRTLRGLFSALNLSMEAGNPGSVCVQPWCAAAPAGDGGAWLSLSRIPPELPLINADSAEAVDFIVARDFGAGHVLVYAHDGLTLDDELRYDGDNLQFAENALRWLGAAGGGLAAQRQGECPAGPPHVGVWSGTYATLARMTLVEESVRRRGWTMSALDKTRLRDELRCVDVLWYLSDWIAPEGFAERDVPIIAQFVRDGGGLLVGALGWSYWQFDDRHPPLPYPADDLGKVFGFSLTRDAFDAPNGKLIRLLDASQPAADQGPPSP